MAPFLAPHAHTATQGSEGATTLVFVPIDGRIVFWTCVVLIVFCLVEFWLRMRKGYAHDKAD